MKIAKIALFISLLMGGHHEGSGPWTSHHVHEKEEIEMGVEEEEGPEFPFEGGGS